MHEHLNETWKIKKEPNKTSRDKNSNALKKLIK